LADRYGVPIVEDDPYGQLRYEGENLPSIESIDANLREQNGCYTGNVIYLSSFSKILAPGLRLAWMVAPTEVISKLITAKQGVDLHTATFNQIVAYEISQNDFLDHHVKRIQDTYRIRRDAMLDSLEEHMPEEISWTHPDGGLFLWVTTPPNIDTLNLFSKAESHKVAFVPGIYFYTDGQVNNTMRLNFSYCTPDVINEGICRLGQLLKQELINSK
jgi:2-aminoadipate transaminase